MKFELILIVLACLYSASEALKGKAQLTHYQSYAPCCKESPNYDPKAPTEECVKYGACKYLGQFAAFSTRKSFSWVQSNNLVAFYDDKDPNNNNWNKYARKQIRLSKNGKTFVATVVDKCGNRDCGNCCRTNSKGGYLVDMEHYTVLKNLGKLSAASGTIDFEIV